FTGVISQHPEVRRVILYLIFASDGRPELRARLQQLYRSMRRLFMEGLKDVVADRQQRQQLATLVVAALDGIFLQWLVDPDAIDLKALHEQVQRLTVLVTTSVRSLARKPRRRTRG
ncbi:MAG: TetR family transcriptional regulator C-terminal domain-containing protein, partial [Deltaproteobacteria bacterium]|nr:TetR family transcriptional regulator C-terminal domain-containing protein [Deltaproteobacteria bacterium]